MSSMSLRNLTWQEVAACVALLAGVVAAYKLLGELPAGVLLVVSCVVNLLLGRRACEEQGSSAMAADRQNHRPDA